MQFLVDLGLDYLSLNRAGDSLSAGEFQRARLAASLGSQLTGVCYVIDEPTAGLHFEDVRKLLVVLHSLVEKGNTVLVIEHNLEVIKTADHIIDVGPEGGIHGGMIVASGSPEHIVKNKKSITGQFLKPVLERKLLS